MSRGKNLQEMENAVTKGAKPAEPMQTMAGVSYEDLGGPTPENNSPTDDSNKLKDPAGEGSYAANLNSDNAVTTAAEARRTLTVAARTDSGTGKMYVQQVQISGEQ